MERKLPVNLIYEQTKEQKNPPKKQGIHNGVDCLGAVPEKLKIKCEQRNSNQYNLLAVSPLLVSQRGTSFRSRRNVIVTKIIPCCGLTGPGCEQRRTDKWQLHLSESPLRLASPITQSNSVAENCLGQHWAVSALCLSVWKYQWAFVRLPLFYGQSSVVLMQSLREKTTLIIFMFAEI